jgi:hypothetical protein
MGHQPPAVIEQRQQCRTQSDEDSAQPEVGDDAEGQYTLLMLTRHSERGHDDHEDEEMVDGQALLHDIAGEVLRAVLPPHDLGEDTAP